MEVLYAVNYPLGSLSKKEEARYGHELAWRLLYYVMEQKYGRKWSSLTLVRNSHGKPRFSNCPVQFSLSHCAGFVCCTFSEWEIGIDAERLRPYDPKLARRICAPAELKALEALPERAKNLMTLWTLKESLMKAVGEGFHYGFQNAEFLWEHESFQPVREDICAVSFSPVSDILVSACGFGPLPKKVELLDLDLFF